MDSKTHVDELQNDGPERFDIFELLRFGRIDLGEEMRELPRIELNGRFVGRCRVSFVNRCSRCFHGGRLS
ncbi:MAG: hypothetical protein KDI65_03515 [Alphaproteobacteria bacterium]|nr:hypothetical protein [Alphaproteobacteria bacterium]